MKYLFSSHIKVFLSIIIFSSVLVSCSEEDEPGTPVITNIRLVAEEGEITTATFGDAIAIQGSNLLSTRSITFNGVSAGINTALMTDNNIIVSVPDEAPDATAVDNKIILTTASGVSTSADFTVIVPGPTVTAFSKEFPAPGETLFIRGSSFYDVERVVMPGGVDAEVVEFEDESIEVIVPEGVGAGSVTVETPFGSTESTVTLRDLTGAFVDFDDLLRCWGDITDVAPEDADPVAIAGNYVYVNTPVSAGNFFLASSAIGMCGSLDVLNSGSSSPDQWALKFEANIISPWSNGHILIKFNDQTEEGVEYFYEWSPYVGDDGGVSTFVTDGWETFVIPLSEFQTRKDFVPNEEPLAPLTEWIDYNFVFQNGSTEDILSFEAAFDNFRMVSN